MSPHYPHQSPAYAGAWTDAQRTEVGRLESAPSLTEWERGALTALRRAAADPLDRARVTRLLAKHPKPTESGEGHSLGILNGKSS